MIVTEPVDEEWIEEKSFNVDPELKEIHCVGKAHISLRLQADIMPLDRCFSSNVNVH